MALTLKTRKNNANLVERALRLRSKDFENEDLSRREEDSRLANLLEQSNYRSTPGYSVNQPISSNQFREFLRDSRFLISLNNLELLELEKDIHSFAKTALNNIERLQKEILTLDSSTIEQEVRIYKNYDYVHYNGFTRALDMPLSQSSKKWLVDFKTDLSFDSTQFLNVVPGSGITLPILDKLNIVPTGVQLVGEETDVGDTKHPIISTPPRYVILSDKIFRHMIVRREFDVTTRKYNRNKSNCTLLFELPGIQLINWLKLSPAAGSTVLVESVSYINEAGEEVFLTSLETESDAGVYYLFEPIRARYVKIKLVQYAPVMKLGRNHGNLQTQELNKVLEGLSWNSKFDEDAEYIEGRVFDFSIKNVSFGLNQYATSGIYRSKDIKIKNIASASIVDQLDLLPIVSRGNISGRIDSLPSADVYSEYYLGVSIRDNSKTKIIEDLIPIPDSYPVQVEFLPLIGGEGKVKLLPDLLWNLDKKRILVATPKTFPRMLITTEIPHGFVQGDEISILGSGGHLLVGDYTVGIVESEYAFRVINLNDPIAITLTENTTPRFYVYKKDAVLNDRTNPPFKLFKDGVEQFIGLDYVINFGTDQAWADSFPKQEALTAVLEDPRSGKMRVRLLNPSYESVYWVTYRPLANQYLGKTKLVSLKSGRVVFDKIFRDSNGTINSVAILRTDFINPYITPLLRNYSLKIREYKKRIQ